MRKALLLLGIILFLTACGDDEQANTDVEESDDVELVEEASSEQQEKEVVIFSETDEAKQERDNFIEVFNSYEEVEDITDLQEPREEATAIWQTLHEGQADIEIKYDMDGNVIGYHVSFDPELEGGLLYAYVVASSLELNPDTFLSHVEKSIQDTDFNESVGEDRNYDYTENGYKISFSNFSDLGYFIVNFDKE